MFRSSPKPFIDRTRGDADLAALQSELAAGTWHRTAQSLDAADPNRREFLVEGLTEGQGREPWADAWVAAETASATARLVWGAAAIQWAWQARTNAPAEGVPTDRWKVFYERLHLAEEQLSLAAQMNPADSAPWVDLIWSGLGLQIPHEEAAARWNELVRRNPVTEIGAAARLSYLSEKWHGSHELMWSFVRELLRDEPEGSPRWHLVAIAHLEHWLGDSMKESSAPHARRYFSQASVRDEIAAAYEQYLGSPAKRWSGNERRYREQFACCFYLIGDRAALRRELELIGRGISLIPWGYLGSPVAAYESAWKAAGLV